MYIHTHAMHRTAHAAYARRLKVNRVAATARESANADHAGQGFESVLSYADFSSHSANDNMQVILVQPEIHTIDEVQPPKIALSSLDLAILQEARDQDETGPATMYSPDCPAMNAATDDAEISDLVRNRDGSYSVV